MEAMERTRTEKFPKNQVIDCERWKSFVIVGDTIQFHEIRFKFDNASGGGIKSESTLQGEITARNQD